MKPADGIPGIHNLEYLEAMYAVFERDPAAVPGDIRAWFERDRSPGPPGPVLPGGDGRPLPPPELVAGAIATAPDRADIVAQERLYRLVNAYRVRGHIVARLDPLGQRPPDPPELDPGYFGFTGADLDRAFFCESLLWPGPMTLRTILERLRNTYCRFIGVQYMHIDNVRTRQWLQERMEVTENRLALRPEIQRRILTRLTDAVIFEDFIRKKFVGAKTFSLEGCETLIPLLDLAIEKAGEQGVREIVLGMAHRGRLNVLANIIRKSSGHIFHEFTDDEPEKHLGGGDVKYHLGHSNDWTTAAGARVHLSLCFNPSHLEFVNPVVLGRVRAKQDRFEDASRELCMGLLIHGDAAFAGEGIIQETLNLSQLEGFGTGGTLHVVVNNQIGFTTPPSQGRSCLYATDVARMLQVPVFHVNGEDPESVAQCLHVAMDFRKEFKRDAVIDMYGYRRLGHNESDEPSFTQPILYEAIRKRPSVREGYLESLLSMDGLTREEGDAIAASRREHLEKALSEAREVSYEPPGEKPAGVWEGGRYHGGPEYGAAEVKTSVDVSRLQDLLRRLTERPADFTPHPKLERLRENWREMADGTRPIDWAAAEMLALATLAAEGVRVRFTGQDVERGTFSHRHAVLHDYAGKGSYAPLQHLAPDQAPVEVHNSPLSEAGVLGFEYGYSLDFPDALVLWEAQFGDFANAGQVIIDQFITSAEDKWRRLSGIVLLLPHGFEGTGPEHASARLERFLQLCAEDNIQVVCPTTPAQHFHLLRRQALRAWRKPLVIMTPKSLLRLPECVSGWRDLAFGTFHRVLPDPKGTGKPRRILLCTGKIYYELERHRAASERNDVAIVRIEQLYPWRPELVAGAVEAYPSETPVFWVQEEPENMGAWEFLRLRLGETVGGRFPLAVVARPESASPATGSASAHRLEQQRLVEVAFG